MVKVIRVVAPHFVGGMEITDGVVTRVPPIIRWALHKSEKEVVAYFLRRGYIVQELPLEVSHG